MPTGDYLSGRHYFFAHFLYDGLLFFQWVVRTKVLGLEDNLMTNEQREQITTMRQGGIGYIKIAQELGLSENTVKSYCRRQNSVVTKEETARCAECGKPIDISTRGGRRFCSDTCRMKWWKKHPKADMPYTANCTCCGKEIQMRRKGERKYCSHHCYIAARYKDGGGND